MHKESRWAQEIIALQQSNGSWGYYHSLAVTSESPITTEQALRRLEVLGFSMEDACIQKAVAYMDSCLAGADQIPDRQEKLHDWNIFSSMILATWIRRFTTENTLANSVAEKWARVVTAAFRDGQYDYEAYTKAYHDVWGMKPKGGRLIDFVQFYGVSMIAGLLDPETEERVMCHIIDKPAGIYYIYDKCLRVLPEQFASKQTTRYLGAIELLAEYPNGRKQLGFVVDWLNDNRNENGKWDLGSSAKAFPYFPLSDNWRSQSTREKDCTERIEKLIQKIAV